MSGISNNIQAQAYLPPASASLHAREINRSIVSPRERYKLVIEYFKSINKYTEIMKKVIDVHYAMLPEFTGNAPLQQQSHEYYWINRTYPNECNDFFRKEMELLVPGFIGEANSSFDVNWKKQNFKYIGIAAGLLVIVILFFLFYRSRNK